jgi:hypothetical protein
VTTKNFVVKNGLTTGNINLYAGNSTISANSVVANLSVPATANLGAVGNITITGGSSGQFLQTNGSGVLSWATASSSGAGALGMSVDTFTGNGVQTNFTLSSTPDSVNYTIATVQGVVQPRSYYSVVGSTLTFSTAPPSTSLVEITTITGNASGSSTYANANVANYLPTFTGNLSGNSLTVQQDVSGNGALRLQGIANGNSTINIGGEADIDVVANIGNINLYTANNQPWIFDQDGNLTLPSGGSIYSQSSTPSGNPGNTIILQPAGSGVTTNQQLLVYPTAGDGDHIHMTSRKFEDLFRESMDRQRLQEEILFKESRVLLEKIFTGQELLAERIALLEKKISKAKAIFINFPDV